MAGGIAEGILTKMQKEDIWNGSVVKSFAGFNSGKVVAPGVDTFEEGLAAVGWWMSQAEYNIMKSTGRVVHGAGGKTSVAIGGRNSFAGAAKSFIYAEFPVQAISLVPGGKPNWFSILGPHASKSQLFMLNRQGGQLNPQ